MYMLSNKKGKDVVKETFHGYIENTRDSLLLFEACKRGIIPRITRRLQDRERYLIRSGSIFCFDEHESGIKRWTDGLVWSPSRILGNFLIYREMDDKKTIRNGLTDEYGMRQSGIKNVSNNISRSTSLSSTTNDYAVAPDFIRIQREKALVGSLKNSSKFKKNGLIKKSMSLIVDGVQQHIVSYYSKDDVLSNRLKTPSSIVELSSLEVSPGLRLRQNFRIPIFLSEETSDDRFMDDFLGHSTAKRKYADMTKQSYAEISSSNSSFSPTSSVSSNSCGNAYLTLLDGQSQNRPQQKAEETSTVNVHNNLYASASQTRNSSYPTVKSTVNTIVQPIPSSHVNSNTSNIVQQVNTPLNNQALRVSYGESIYQSQTASDLNDFNNLLLPQSMSCNKILNKKDQTFQQEEIDLATNMMMTSGISLESKSDDHNSGITKSSRNVSFDKKISNSCKTNNITTAKSFSNISKEASKAARALTSSYTSGMSFNFNSGSAINNNTAYDYFNAKGGYYSPSHFDDYHQEQNPHQHLFSSSSFHAINHAAIPHRAEIATNSFMLDMNVLLGTGWNEFELQM